MTVLTPSTGAMRPSLMRLNVRGFEAGERVLYRGFSGWRVDAVAAPLDKAIRIAGELVQYRDVMGVVPVGTDEDALVGQLQHADARRAELIKRAKDGHRERVEAVLLGAALERQGPPPPEG